MKHNPGTNGVGQSTPVTKVNVPQQGAQPKSTTIPARATHAPSKGGK